MNERVDAGVGSGVSGIDEIIADYRAGKMVILVDDEDRENEGDLVIAAQAVTPESINFMAAHGRGLVCLALTEARCRQLGLRLMVDDNNAPYQTNFTVSIEAAEGVTTGISAADRAATVAAAVRAEASAADIVTPGHVFPIMAQPGGVLTRAGHTEAGVDLARICGFEPASVLCEILNPDGSMARLKDLTEFGARHGLKIGAIAELIRWRLRHEPTVQRVSEHRIRYGSRTVQAVVYLDRITDSTHLGLKFGAVRADRPVLTRVHVHSGVFDTLTDALSRQPSDTVRAIAAMQEHGGILVLLDYPTDGRYVSRKLAALGDFPSPEAETETASDLRMVGAGSQILRDLGAGKVRVLGTPRRIHGLSGFGLEVVEYVADY